MPAYRLTVRVSALALAVVATPTLACETPRPISPEVVAERARIHQAEMWMRSDAVFLSQAGALERIGLPGGHGFSTKLTPSLALKGDLPTERIGIRHSTVTSCGAIPFLDALVGQEGDWFVTYVRILPSGLSVDATVPLNELADPDALRAWRKIADPGPRS